METRYSLFHYKTFWQKRKKENEEKISAISGEKQVVKCTPACAMQAMQLATFYCCMTKQRLFFFNLGYCDSRLSFNVNIKCGPRPAGFWAPGWEGVCWELKMPSGAPRIKIDNQKTTNSHNNQTEQNERQQNKQPENLQTDKQTKSKGRACSHVIMHSNICPAAWL